MAHSRREFSKPASVTAVAGAAGCSTRPRAASAPSPASPALPPPRGHAAVGDLALDAARGARASYAEVRVDRNRTQAIATRERRVQNLVDNDAFRSRVRGSPSSCRRSTPATSPSPV